MSKVLYIKANIKTKGMKSRTFQISEHFIDLYQKQNPNDEIEVLDLYEEGFQPLQEEDLYMLSAKRTDESKKDPKFKYAYQFVNADKYVIAAPMWNLGLPSILKSYIDYACLGGFCFKYTPEGQIGLLQDKKALFITSRGGIYSDEPFLSMDLDMGEKYLSKLFNVFGISDFNSIIAEKLDIQGLDTNQIVNNAMEEAEKISTTF
ncbi:MAG: NAD(P)H-dependent oxidoreductase [Bacteroidia bacterium]|nr:NAD(P)H-dependent oxidoreductase [Bacteroidia bacterium]